MFVQIERRRALHSLISTLANASVILLLCGSISFAQNPKDLPPEIAAELAKSPKPPLSNQVVGIDVNRFVGSPLLSPVHVTENVILQRSILRRGDPYHPGDPGAVLEYWKDLSSGTVLGYARSAIVEIPDEEFWYVESGKGRLDNGNGYWDLHEGIGVLIPPHARHRIENTTDEPLQMLILTYKATTPGGDILVRDVHTLSLPEEGSHWNYFGTNVFVPEDGLEPNEVIALISMPPMTNSEPHAHIPHQAEVWIKLPPFSAYMMLGSEVREMPPNTGFLSPPNSQTTHSVLNLMKDDSQKWLYLAHWVWDLGPLPKLPTVEPKPLGNLH